ncbi:unnamed protein product, partial [Chrysoparadoxa australica]
MENAFSSPPPSLLDCSNPSHVGLIVSAISHSAGIGIGADTGDQGRLMAEQFIQKAKQVEGFSSMLLLIGQNSADHHPYVRAVAVIVLKAMVTSSWRVRGGKTRAVTDTEKGQIRNYLEICFTEQDQTVSLQLAVLTAKIARLDWPREWPSLFSSLLAASQAGDWSQRGRALTAMHQVLKELATKRIGLDKASMAEVSASVMPVLRNMWEELSLQMHHPDEWQISKLIVKIMSNL